MLRLPEWDLTHEYLESLKVVREAGYASGIPMLVRNVDIKWAARTLLPVARIDHQGHNNTVKVEVSPDLDTMSPYRVERLEVLTYIAAECIAKMSKMDAPQLAALCISLGVCNSRISITRERWRRLGMELDPRQKEGWRSSSLVALMYEDRPKCGWCKTPLVTGSSSLVRKDLHEGCYDYILKVVRPQLIEERQQRKMQEAATAEK